MFTLSSTLHLLPPPTLVVEIFWNSDKLFFRPSSPVLFMHFVVQPFIGVSGQGWPLYSICSLCLTLISPFPPFYVHFVLHSPLTPPTHPCSWNFLKFGRTFFPPLFVLPLYALCRTALCATFISRLTHYHFVLSNTLTTKCKIDPFSGLNTMPTMLLF